MSTPISNVGDKLIVGQLDTSIGDIAQQITPGTAVINGPCYIGMTASPGVPRATCMIGPSLSGSPVSLETIGITNIFGSLNVFAISNITGLTNKFGATIRNALSLNNGVALKNALDLSNGPIVFNAPLIANASITTPLLNSTAINTAGEATIEGILSANGGSLVQGILQVNGFTRTDFLLVTTSVSAPIKLFNISHPSKPGYRLIHSCLEGPENGVYCRGHLEGKDYIELPNFWNNLIDPETITVHFTPHKLYQELYVKTIEWGKIIRIANNLGGPINCDYVVYAERKDVEKLVIERKGDVM